MALIDVKNYEVGLVTVFLFDLIFQVYQEQIKNYIILYFGGSFIFLVGILAIMYGLNIKIKLIAKLSFILYPLRFILKLNFIKLIFKFFNILVKSHITFFEITLLADRNQACLFKKKQDGFDEV